jgi:hypothetical protein
VLGARGHGADLLDDRRHRRQTPTLTDPTQDSRTTSVGDLSSRSPR